MNLTNTAGAPLSATTTSATVRLMNSGVFETRVMLAAWPGDDLIADSLDAASELNTVLTTNLSRSGPIPLPTGFMSLTFGGGGMTLPVIGAEPRVLGVIDQLLPSVVETLFNSSLNSACKCSPQRQCRDAIQYRERHQLDPGLVE